MIKEYARPSSPRSQKTSVNAKIDSVTSDNGKTPLSSIGMQKTSAYPARVVLFDLDGTLVNSLLDLTAAFNFALETMGQSALTPEALKSLLGHGAASVLASVLDPGNPGSNAVQKAVGLFKSFYLRNLSRYTQVIPGVMELLDYLHDIPLLVVSNKDERLARGVLEQLDLK